MNDSKRRKTRNSSFKSSQIMDKNSSRSLIGKKNSLLQYWEYECLKLSSISSNVNSSFEKACSSIYRELRKFINNPGNTSQSIDNNIGIDKLIPKLIEDQPQLSANDKLELYNIFDKGEFRKIIMKRAIETMHKYQL